MVFVDKRPILSSTLAAFTTAALLLAGEHGHILRALFILKYRFDV